MKLCAGVLMVVAACAFDDEPVDTGEVESESVPTTSQGTPGQGTTMQGTTMQGTTMQGTTMQGTTMQGTTMQGSYGGGVVSDATVDGTAIVFWVRSGTTWQQRFPNKTCYWNSTRSTLISCEYAPKYSTASPLVGSTWPTTFTKPNTDGTTTTIPVTLRIEAVRSDTTIAMHPLTGSNYATSTPVTCENPDKCRPNRDMWNYDVKVIDVVDANGNQVWLCPTGQTAIALAGTWDAMATFQPSTSQFTFACTNGTIAKCARWGYRPYDSAIPDNSTTKISLAPYHQACIRAAAADYCGQAKSMTRNGTLVDIYDYNSNSEPGFIPKLDGFVFTNYDTVTAFTWEAQFDPKGAFRLDHFRYQELSTNPAWDVMQACPGVFWDSSQGENFANMIRHEPLGWPSIYIDSSPSCSHSEFTIGKWLHHECSDCSGHVPSDCNNPLGAGWTQECVTAAQASPYCRYNSDKMSTHGECEVGVALNRYDTGCTLTVCLANPNCCDPTYGWTQSCVNAANTTCKGGRESFRNGFCGWSVIAPPTTTTTASNG